MVLCIHYITNKGKTHTKVFVKRKSIIFKSTLFCLILGSWLVFFCLVIKSLSDRVYNTESFQSKFLSIFKIVTSSVRLSLGQGSLSLPLYKDRTCKNQENRITVIFLINIKPVKSGNPLWQLFPLWVKFKPLIIYIA